jgi:hypothetical protein
MRAFAVFAEADKISRRQVAEGSFLVYIES